MHTHTVHVNPPKTGGHKQRANRFETDSNYNIYRITNARQIQISDNHIDDIQDKSHTLIQGL
jgi:hypothetical protein